jgi:hypothetical protein
MDEKYSELDIDEDINEIPYEYPEQLELLSGSSDSSNHEGVSSYFDYENLYRKRHDIFHKFVCKSRNIPMGEKPIHSLFNDLSGHKYYDLIKNQTPDSVTISGINVFITEVTVSYSNYAYTKKVNKYALLKQVLIDSGYHVTMDVIVMPMGATSEGMLQFCQDHNFDLSEYKKCIEEINKIEIIIQQIETDHPDWLYARLNQTSIMPDVDFSDEDCIRAHNENDRKAFNSEDDLRNVLEAEEPMNITDNDEVFLQLLVDKADSGDDLELLQSQRLDLTGFWEYHDTMNDNIPLVPRGGTATSVAPLPLLLPRANTIYNRDTMDDEKLVFDVKKKLQNCDDLYLQSISVMDIEPLDKEVRYLNKIGINRIKSECFGHIKFTNDIKWHVSIGGPGRKGYIKCSDPSIEHVRAQREKTLYITGSKLNLEQLDEILWFFSRKSKINSLNDLSDPIWHYLRFVQNVFQEVNINFLRKELKWNHVIKPTIYPGVFIAIHTGPSYLTGAKNTICWFKLFGYTKDIVIEKFTTSWVFKQIRDIGNGLWCTKWISTDPHRLNHYIRCYDKILMSYLTYLHGSEPKPGNLGLVDAYNNDTSDALGLIAMIYLEDKRCTSKTLQDVRYVIMETLSHQQYWNDVLDKFKDPIRSPLQLYIIRRIILYIEKAQFSFIRQTLLSSKFGVLEGDTTGLLTRKAGSFIQMPRILTRSMNEFENLIPFSQILCEMYFTMLFNKDQDDATHSSFQVLEKILKSENNMEKVKNESKLHTGFRNGELADFIYLLNSPKKPNQFSRRAIMIASKLQNKSEYNKRQGQLSYEMANVSGLVNRTIDDYATFKSSATFDNLVYNPIKIGFMQNQRRRCIEGVYDLQKKGMLTSIDVLNKTRHEDTAYQVFKKNQIGGVREILILSLATRIRINVMESYSRLICAQDSREMLTHGEVKNTRFVGIQQDLKVEDKQSVIMHYNFDKKRWGPSFMPIQFLYMFKPFQKYMGNFFRAFTYILIKHTNKKCFYPDHLIKAWNNNTDRDHTRDELLTIKKKEYIKTKNLYFINESNMGQGILHYTSSLLHLGVVSLREEIYKRLCLKRKLKPCKVIDLVSSDDSYSAQSIPDKKTMFIHIELFLRAQSVVERVMNVETSKSKSSMSPLVGEFNSLFISNLTTYPTLIKFALSSVGTFSTDSFNQIVKESFNSMRMLVENGGSLELYKVAYDLNKVYAERMYHTYTGAENDPNLIFNIERKLIPYQFGIFPEASILSLIMMGPEAHNYRILSQCQNSKGPIMDLFRKAHSLAVTDIDRYAADLAENSDIMVGASSIIAMTRVNKRLQKLWKLCDVSRENIRAYLLQDPLFPIRKPRNLEESILRVRMKLMQSSAVDAMKITNGSLFFGRISATYSARCFKLIDDLERKTFKECLTSFLNRDNRVYEDFQYFQQQVRMFDIIEEVENKVVDYDLRSNLETRMYKKLYLDDITSKLSNPLAYVLAFFWQSDKFKDESNNSIIRDWVMIKKHMPMINESLEQTLLNIDPDREKSITKLILILMRLTGLKQSTIKGFIFGSSSKNFERSAETLKFENLYMNLTSKEFSEVSMTRSTAQKIDKTLLLYNEFILRKYEGLNVEHLVDHVDLETITHICSLPNYPPAFKKRLFTMALYFNIIDNVDGWTSRVGQVIEYWIKPQVKIGDVWAGDCNLVCFYGDAKCQVKVIGSRVLCIMETSLDDHKNYIILKHAFKTLYPTDKISDEFLQKKLGYGNFSIFKNRLIRSGLKDSGFRIDILRIPHSRPVCTDIQMKDGYYDLLDSRGYKFLRSQLSLFHVDKYDLRDDFEDFKVNNFSFLSLVKMKAFSNNFNIMMYTETELLDKLDDNTINTTMINKEIIDKIKSTATISQLKVTQSEELKFDIEDIELEDIYQQILEDDKKEGVLESPFEDYLEELFSSEMFLRQVMPGTSSDRRISNQAIWNRIIHIKSFLMLKLWTGKTFIGLKSINYLMMLQVNPEVICAAINCYQVIKSKNSEIDSPTRFTFIDSPDYKLKFGEDIRGVEEYLEK